MKNMCALAAGLFLSLLLGASHAQADIIHLKHGRTMEGAVVKKTKRNVHVRVKGGGVLVLPKAVIKRIESKLSAQADYVEQVYQTDMNDPDSIDALALWASQRGMGRKAKELGDMARGLRLELRIERARNKDTAQAFVDAFHWARGVGLADEVLLWILSQGTAIDSSDSALKLAYVKFNQDLDDRQRARARAEELRGRPHYAMPVNDKRTGASRGAQASAEMARIKARKGHKGNAKDDRVWMERMRALRLIELEKQLERKRASQAAEREAERLRREGR